ncbi:AbrB family transcriptional regulator [Anthocerotibacter panamensis]|uniref:AbrB family transcriptional regulator n=1 Tax=Anthocerotibacter panamensis TaxID=2857077 RepID=UPI001C40413D|nr:AbrB family transcriptional regulator [Anthocerotibacter panamensis]
MGEVALTGRELLKKVAELSATSSKKEIARSAGYVTVSKSGKERVNLAKFMSALLAAKGVSMNGESASTRGGRSAGYRVQVQKNGNLLVGAAYTREMGLEPGTEFVITLGRKHIKLVKINLNGQVEDSGD